MRIGCPPSYTNIFMTIFEEKHTDPFIEDKVELYLRF